MDNVIPKCTAAPTIIRRDSRRRFVVIDHEAIDDPNLTARALGFLAYLLGKPDNWETRTADLMKRFGCGKDYVYAALGEIQKAGYAERRTIRNELGRIVRQELIIYETAQSVSPTCPDPDLPEQAEPEQVIPPQLNNKEAPKTEFLLKNPPLPSVAAPPQKRRRSRLPEDWTPKPTDLAFAAREFPGVDVKAQTALFRDHWRGNGDVKDDWDATFRNWIRRAPNFAPRTSALVSAGPIGNGHRSQNQINADIAARRMGLNPADTDPFGSAPNEPRRLL